MTLLNVSHWQQRQPADCLAACSAMVLQYLQIPFAYDPLVVLLETQYYGAAFSNVRHLESMGLFVRIGEWGGTDLLEQHLKSGLPILVNVNTKELTSYWTRETSHVVTVIGLDEEAVSVNDPAFDQAPQRIPIQEFLLAWDEQYQRYAVIGLEQFE